MVDLKVTMMLGAFNILVCDQTCSMADIKVKGEDPDGSVFFQLHEAGSETCHRLLRVEQLFVETRIADPHIGPPAGRNRSGRRSQKRP